MATSVVFTFSGGGKCEHKKMHKIHRTTSDKIEKLQTIKNDNSEGGGAGKRYDKR